MTRQEEACLALHCIATNELGVHEIPGPEAEQRIIEYGKHTTLKPTSDEIAWCSDFANYVVDTTGEQYGFKGTHSAAARSWLDWGVVLATTVKGCIVVIDRKDANNPNAAHVCFYDSNNGNGTIKCLGGNQGDSVKFSNFPSTKIIAYRAPKIV
jgi:uncharacterized protein (TIGR02594 family)